MRLPLGLAFVDVPPALPVDGEIGAVKTAQVAAGTGLGGTENGEMVPFGIEFLGEGQAVGRTEIDAEGTSFADLSSNEDRALTRALFGGGVAHKALFQANLVQVLSTFAAEIK